MFRKLHKPSLWLHGLIAIAGLGLLFAVPFLYGWGMFMMYGIGDGHMSHSEITQGACILLLVVFIIFSSLGAILTLLFRLFFENVRTLPLRICFLSAGLVFLATAAFFGWRWHCRSLANDAIYWGEIEAYERAARWRFSGDIDSDLYCAARWGKLFVVDYLISKGANPNARPKGGDSVLAGAIPNVLNKPDGNIPVVEYLKSHGATN